MPHNFYFLERENMPCLYDLAFDLSGPAIIVKAHRDFLAQFPNFDNSPKIKDLQNKFGLPEFQSGSSNENFGFGGVFSRQGCEDSFAVFKIAIPQIKKHMEKNCPICRGDGKGLFGNCLRCEGKGRVPKICEMCNGTGRDDGDRACLNCTGLGIEFYYDWASAYQVTASFSVFFDLAFLSSGKDKAVYSYLLQLILINTAVDRESNSLDGTYSIPLARWLASFSPKTKIVGMEEAMMSVYKKIFGEISSHDKFEICAEVSHEKGWLNVSCPGDRCDLYPAHSSGPVLGKGYQFSCHNVDTPAQQLTLLSGLAALCGEARKRS